MGAFYGDNARIDSMFPPWLRLTLYIAGAAAGVWALWRVWQVYRTSARARSVAPESQASPLPPAAVVIQESPADVPLPSDASQPSHLSILKDVTQQSADSDLSHVSILKPASLSNAATPQFAPNAETAPAAAATEWRPAQWADQPLLAAKRGNAGALPTVRPEDIPVTRTDDYVFGGLTPTLAEFLPESAGRYEEARKELQSAGFYQPHALQNYAAVRYLLIMLGLVFAGVILILVPARFEWMAMLGLLVLPLLGWAFPRLYIRGIAAERRSEIERGMPDLLDMLNMCVSQGLTVPDALRRILPDIRVPYPALAQELRIVNEQAMIGSMPTALENFGKRVDIPEVHSFTSLLTQTEKMGTSISDALMSYSDTMRESLKQRVEEKGNRATFRLLFPTVLCLMPAVYLFLLGPAIVELSNFFSRGGRDSLDQGSAVIQRINQNRGLPGPLDN